MSHHRFRRAVESHNEAEIAASLAGDVVLNSPGSSRPFRGRATVAALVSAAPSNGRGKHVVNGHASNGHSRTRKPRTVTASSKA